MAHSFRATIDDSRDATFQNRSTREKSADQTLWKLLILSALAYIVWGDRIEVNFKTGAETESSLAVKASLEEGVSGGKRKPTVRVEMPRGAMNNTTFAIDPEFADRNEVPHTEVEARMEVVRDYLKRYSQVAVAEMHKFGIPASITLAQGLLESNAGESKLAQKTNNHFGMKCFSRRCGKGHCANFTDDSHKDFFIRYQNPWGSYRAHSEFLKNTARYAQLFKLKKTDYRAWARGLSKAGYATDKKYGDKLIALIENLRLERFDKM